ncbi:MAG: hypothetical protein CBD47_02975 [Synechococcus sp. TMED187]|nr:MAG: hypothetical protein CBD47_02975 [Synechococcus sp. TMED187]
MRRPAPVTPSAPLSQPRAVPLTLTQTRDRDAVPERAAMPREMTGFYRAGVQVGGCFVGIAAGRPSSSGSGYTDLVYFIRPGSPKRKQFRPGVDPARRVAKIEGLLEIEFGRAAWQEHRRVAVGIPPVSQPASTHRRLHCRGSCRIPVPRTAAAR